MLKKINMLGFVFFKVSVNASAFAERPDMTMQSQVVSGG